MLSKHAQESVSHLPPAKRCKGHVQNLLTANRLSGPEFVHMASDMAAAGIGPMDEFVPKGQEQNLHKHAARNVRRKLLRRSLWPALYEATVPCWGVKSGQVKECKVYFLLPHEMLDVISRFDKDALADLSGLDGHTTQLYNDVKQKIGQDFTPLGVWGDGVPVQWDRAESIEVISYSLPGNSGRLKSLRMPFVCVSRKNIAKGQTFERMLKVLVWSLEAMASGIWPTCRHDGQELDKARAAKKGSPLNFKAVLLEVLKHSTLNMCNACACRCSPLPYHNNCTAHNMCIYINTCVC